MMLKRLLRRDQSGVGAVEFALVAPVLISFVIGISQMGKLFFANADMKNAMAAGARVASIYPVPEDPVILAAIDQRLVRTGAEDRAEAEITRDVDADGNPFIEIEMTYSVPLEFIFFNVEPVTLTDSRIVFTQVTQANQTTYTGTTSASTTSGGTTSSASTTSATSASSTTSSGTTTTTGSTTSSGNASSGNNNGSSGHDHGDCNKKC